MDFGPNSLQLFFNNLRGYKVQTVRDYSQPGNLKVLLEMAYNISIDDHLLKVNECFS